MDSNFEKIIDFFKLLGWPLLSIKEELFQVSFGDQILYEFKNKIHKIYFFKYNQRERRVEKRYYYLESIEFTDLIDFDDLIYINANGYKVSYYNQLNNILLASQRKIKHIIITNECKQIEVKEDDKIKISPNFFTKILSDAKFIYDTVKSYSGSVEHYLTIKSLRKFKIKDVGFTTSTKKGEFEFIIDRFNLTTKKAKKDFTESLNLKDIVGLEKLADSLIKKDIFSEEFLRKLDEYFIKEKLQDILKIGRSIMGLKSEDVNTNCQKNCI
jgi:hypothetical protein